MRPIIRDFLVGATAILGVSGLLAGLIFFGEMSFDRHYSFKVKVQNAGGLAQASRVTMSGVSIGQVTSAEILPATTGGVLLEIKVKTSVQIPRSSIVGIEKGLIGDASLDFAVPRTLTQAEAKDVIRPGEIFDAGNPTTLLQRLADSTEGPLGRLTATAEKIDRLAEVYTTVGERLNDALEPRTVADVAAGKTANVRSAIERLDRTLASADEWLSDAALRRQVKDAVAKADALLTDARETVSSVRAAAAKAEGAVDAAASAFSKIEGAAGKVGDSFDSLAARAHSTLEATERAATELAQTLDTATKGRGTLGQLMQNPDLYNSLNDAARRLDLVLVELGLVLEKMKKEGVRIGL